MSPPHQVVMLKFIKNLSMLSATLDTLQNSNAIEVLTDLLAASRSGTHFRVCQLHLNAVIYIDSFIGNFEPGSKYYVQPVQTK
jgi:hypothetical protein